MINDTEVLWFGLELNLTFKHCLMYWEFSLLPFLSAAASSPPEQTGEACLYTKRHASYWRHVSPAADSVMLNKMLTLLFSR